MKDKIKLIKISTNKVRIMKDKIKLIKISTNKTNKSNIKINKNNLPIKIKTLQEIKIWRLN